jgi:ribonuclease D
MADCVYCKDQQALEQAIAAVGTAGSCVMDCEGLELGDAQGRLTLFQIIPIRDTAVPYLVDIQDLEQQQVDLQALKLLLSVGSVTKVLYDCRNDAAALWYEQGCELQVRTYRRGIHAV